MEAAASGPTMAARDVQVAEPELLAELPVEQADLLPLNVLVERITNNAYQTLQSLTDTLPALSSDAKKAKVYTTAIELRKQFIKLLVIVRWSKDADLLNKARNVIALLVDQQWAHEDVFSGLTQVRKILPNARIFEADLVTAIDVLRTGTYTRLPTSIRDTAVPKAPMSDKEALEVLRSLDQVLTVRLTCTETVPKGLALCRIQDGKAYFRAAGLYEACLTTSGATDDDRWWLLDVTFADTPTDDDGDMAEELTKPYLEGIFASSDALLAPEDRTQETEPPLVRLHAFLEQQTLQRQLHILYYQLQRVERFHWSGNVRFSLDASAHVFEIQYWSMYGGGATGHAQTSPLHRGLLQGKLRLQLHTETWSGAKKVLAELLAGEHTGPGQNSIVVAWETDPSIQAAVDDLPALRLVHLEVETLLLDAIDRHALALMRLFQQQMLEHPGLAGGISGFAVLHSHPDTGFGPRHSLEVHVTDTICIMLYVSTITGRVGIKSLDPLDNGDPTNLTLSLSETKNAALQRMADAISADTAVLVPTLAKFRLQSLTKELELQASWLGLPYVASLSLRAGELDKIGLANGHPLLYLPLGILPTYYILVYFIPGQPITMAMLSVMPVVDGRKTQYVVSSVKWLDRASLAHLAERNAVAWAGKAAEVKVFGQDLASEELDLVFHYCVATVAYSHLEEQLRQELVPFVLVGTHDEPGEPPSSSTDPLLRSLDIGSAELLSPFAGLAKSPVSLQICDWWLPEQCRVEITLTMALQCEWDSEETHMLKDTTLNPHSGTLTYTARDLTSSITQFRQSWMQVARMGTLINSVATYTPSPAFHVALSHVEERKVALTYGSAATSDVYTLSVLFPPTNGGLTPNTCRLEFGSKGPLTNPHRYVGRILENKVNTASNTPGEIWHGLLHVCICPAHAHADGASYAADSFLASSFIGEGGQQQGLA